MINENRADLIPFLGASAYNNGITGYCTIKDIENTSKTGKGKNHELKYKIFKGNCITVTNNGSIGCAYFQKNKFTCSHDITVLYLKNHELTKNIALFLIVQIEKVGKLFSYARKWRPKRMKSSMIMLPVNNDEKPDYEYMEKYIQNIKIGNIENTVKFLEKKYLY